MRRLLRIIILLTVCLLAQNSLQAVNSKIDSLTALLPKLEGSALANTYLELANQYMYVNPAQTIENAQKALDIVKNSEQKKEICYANLLIGAGHIFTGDFAVGEKFINEGLTIAREINNANYISIGLSSLAGYYMNTGNYDKALELFNETLEQAKKAGLDDRAAKAKFNIGSILTNKGDRAGGLRYMTEALKYFESTNNLAITARILNNIAVNYHTWKDYDLALKYYRKTLRLYERNGDILGKVVVLNNIGEIYKDKGQYDMALKYYNQIFDLAKTNDISNFYLAVGWVGLAETYQKKGNDSRAEEYANKALAEFEKSNMPEGQINANLVLSAVMYDNGDYHKARRLAEHCIQLSQKIGIKDLTQKGYLLLSQILEKQRNYREALTSYKQFIQITDSLDKEDETHQLALHRAELDLSEKESEIQLLQKDNEIKELQLNKQKNQSRTLIIVVGFLLIVIALSLSYNKARRKANLLLQEKNNQILDQHEELVRLNQTKDKFLSIIGHDLRNPIGAFKDVVSQLADFPEMFTDELRNQILEELRGEAESTYFLLDNLLLWAKSQQHAIQFKPEKLKLNMVIKNNQILNSRIAESKGVELKSNINEDIFVFADHNMVDLILRNLISNALKFTPENGQVELDMLQVDGFYKIQVKDTGVGIDKDNIPKLFDQNDNVSTYGTNNEKGSGLGLILCKEFVEMNGGEISVDSKKGKGSTFTFSLKRYAPELDQKS